MDNKSIGDKGENFAAEYYVKLGYNVICKNFHSRYGEIDVIAENDDFIVFCEVKSRNFGCASPSMAVDRRKQERLILTAMKYIDEMDCEKQPRFDVFEIWHCDGSIKKYNNIENAFESTDFSGRYDIF